MKLMDLLSGPLVSSIALESRCFPEINYCHVVELKWPLKWKLLVNQQQFQTLNPCYRSIPAD